MADTTPSVQIEAGWKAQLADEFRQPYFQALKTFLKTEKASGKVVYPAGKLIFNAFNSTPFDQVKAVIIGQDPYHGPGQAHGLCFSVMPGVAIPPSLKNIYQELHEDVGFTIPNHGHLQKWAESGVLMLNAILTVEAGQAGSHKGKGWENFTTAAIQKLNKHRENIVFLLWGRYAQQKGAVINRDRHHVLEAAHPSPLARTGFRGCRHFSQTNHLLEQAGMEPIDWQV